MSSESRRARFEANQKARDEAEKAKRSQYGTNYEHPEYAVIPSEGIAVFRPFTANHIEKPELLGFEHRNFHYAFIKGDDGKKFPFTYGFDGWYNHPIYELVKVIAKGKYNKELKQMVYDNADCPLLRRIVSNDEDNVMEKGWRGDKVVLMNIIDRSDNWCAENKHTKVLVKSASYNEEYESWNSSYGFGPSIYTDMLELGDNKEIAINDIDFAVYRYHWKKPRISGNSKIYYDVFLPEYDSQMFNKYGDVGIEAKEWWKEGISSAEELAYDTYDFDSMELYKPSSVTYFLNRMKDFIKSADERYPGNDFLDKFTELSEQEKKEWSEKEKEEAKEEATSVRGHSVEEAPEPEVQEEVITRSRRSRVVEEAPVEKEESVVSPSPDYVGYDSLTDEEKAMITVNADGSLTYNVEDDELEPCMKCEHKFPMDFTTCPSCGQKYR